jgi:cytochrome b6-f complex iron-sulfur subunit
MGVLKKKLKLDTVPELTEVGGEVIVKLWGRDVLLIRDTASTVKGFNARCTHLNCHVQYDEDGQRLACLCHGSRYKLDGTVIEGPAEKRLKTYTVRLRGDAVEVMLL